jgi:hypothetical protein
MRSGEFSWTAAMARAATVGLLLSLYYALDWVRLRRVVAACSATLLRAVGIEASGSEYGSSSALITEVGRFGISADCTYLDLFLILAPLLWRAGRPFTRNVGRLALAAAGVFAVNLLRIALAVRMVQAGASWTVAHGVPDSAIYYPTIAIAAVLAFRSDQSRRACAAGQRADAGRL